MKQKIVFVRKYYFVYILSHIKQNIETFSYFIRIKHNIFFKLPILLYKCANTIMCISKIWTIFAIFMQMS